MKKILPGLLALLLIAGCTPAQPQNQTTSSSTTSGSTASESAEKIQVMTSIHPIDQLVKAIGGDLVETTMFVKPGVDAHDFEPTAKDMAKLKEAKVLFINGLGMEPWATDGAITGATKLMVLGDGLDYIPLAEGHEHEEGEDHTHEGEVDPHVWLGLPELKLMAANTATALTLIAPEHKSDFEENLKKFNTEADALANEFHPKFVIYQGKAFVTGHEAFGYLTRSIGLEQMAVEGPFGEGEPTPQKIKELVDFVKEHRITTIFVEETASPKVSETLARETGAELVSIPTLETSGEIFPSIRDIYQKVLTAMEKDSK